MTIAMDVSYWPDPGVWEILLDLVLLSFTSPETIEYPAIPYNEHFFMNYDLQDCDIVEFFFVVSMKLTTHAPYQKILPSNWKEMI